MSLEGTLTLVGQIGNGADVLESYLTITSGPKPVSQGTLQPIESIHDDHQNHAANTGRESSLSR